MDWISWIAGLVVTFSLLFLILRLILPRRLKRRVV